MCVWQFAPELKMQPWYAVRLVAASPVHVGDASACGATPGVCRITPAANSANRIRLIIVYHLPGNHRSGHRCRRQSPSNFHVSMLHVPFGRWEHITANSQRDVVKLLLYQRRAGNWRLPCGACGDSAPSESSHRTTSIAAMTALNGSARRTRRGPGGLSGHRSQRSPRCQQ